MVHSPNPSKDVRRRYFRGISSMVRHLQKEHHLVSEGQNVGIWIAIGVGAATALGVALENPGVGTAIGVAIGLAIGKYMDKKAKSEGRMI